MGIPNPSNYFKFWDLTKEDKDIFKYPGYGPQRDPFKKGRGEVVRTFQDWKARTLSAYSLEEKEALKKEVNPNTDKLYTQKQIVAKLVAGKWNPEKWKGPGTLNADGKPYLSTGMSDAIKNKDQNKLWFNKLCAMTSSNLTVVFICKC